MINHTFSIFVCFLLSFQSLLLSTEAPLSPASQKALTQLTKLDSEVYYGSYVSYSLLRCSYMQDAWLNYLHTAETREDFLRGMTEIDKAVGSFKSHLNWSGSVVNFFNPGQPRFLKEQTIDLPKGPEAFLNTFKTGRQLNDQEREELFQEEWARYLEEKVVEPFELTRDTVQNLQSGVLYNFALLDDGRIRVALEAPGGREYLANGEAAPGEFAYPNHTILAGSPNQPVLTAGSFLLFRCEDKELMFVSNKSGHFAPYFHSLKAVKEPLQSCGIEPQTVILVPSVDLGEVVIKIWTSAQIPLTLYEEDAQRLFNLAWDRWVDQLDQLDLNLLHALASGNFSVLTRQATASLNRIREEGTYMRSAYCLFTREHEAPKAMHTFIRRFGRLKDAIKHKVPAVIQSEAQWVSKFVQEQSQLLRESRPVIAGDDDIRCYLADRQAELQRLLAQPHLTLAEFHQVKKDSRELGSLFLRLTEDALIQGRSFFVYRSAAQNLLRINLQMATIHDEEVGKQMRGEVEEETVQLVVPEGIKLRLTKFLNQLQMAPTRMEFPIVEKTVFYLINGAKDWYMWHAHMSRHPDAVDSRRNESDQPRILCKRIVEGRWDEPQEDEGLAIELLEIVLAKAKIARNTLILVDASHTVDPSISNYIDCVERVLDAVKQGDPYSAKAEAAQLSKYFQSKGVPTRQLEKYVLTDQESFNEVVRDQVASLQALADPANLTRDDVTRVRANIRSVGDLLVLYLRLGQDYFTMPFVAYQSTSDDCEGLVEELDAWLENPERPISVRAQRMAQRVLGKFVQSH